MPKPKDENKIKVLFEASLRLVLQTGYADFRIASVAKEAGLATGTVYIYFKDKKALINALYQQLKGAKMEETFEGYSPELAFPKGFKLLWINYLKASLKHPERSLFIDQYQNSEILDDKSRSIKEAAYMPLYQYLQKAQDDLFIKNMPVEIMAASLMGSAKEVSRLYFGKTDQVDKDIVESCFEMAWQSIRR
ncbi:MAG: TetR/AcrR family transcriptional regulator [Bacteroidia bacterium]|nr:TetR/AcrR family transcriptional regulator [Bacteroidia bacterium]